MFRGLIVAIAAVLLTCFSCTEKRETKNAYKSDTASISRGKQLFTVHCGSCHNFQRQSIGPNLSGITDSVSYKWLKKFICDPQQMINSGDERAVTLTATYKSVMPSFTQLSTEQIDDLLAYINTHNNPQEQQTKGITDPLPSIQLSEVVVNIKPFVQIPASAARGKRPLARITKMDYLPDTNHLFVIDMRGKMYRLNNAKPEVYLDLAALKPQFVHEPGLGAGFCSFAFHPDFLKNGLLYIAHSEKPGKIKADFTYNDSIQVTYQYVLTEWKCTNPMAEKFSGTSRELLRINMVTVQHGIQEIAFNPYASRGDRDNGNLYVCIGDGGAMDDKHVTIAGSPYMPWGTVLRIDPLGNNSDNGKYGLPADNPFVMNKGGLREVYAYGFRNPHRISWSSPTDAFVANIGEAYIESIYRLRAGMHHGWPIREGNFVIDPSDNVTKLLPMTAADSAMPVNYPLASYDHEWGYAGISGGFVYMGKSIPSLRGKYVFGDIPSGKLFYFDIPERGTAVVKEWRVKLEDTITTLNKICNTNRVDLHFARDAANELYVLTKADGKIFKLIGTD